MGSNMSQSAVKDFTSSTTAKMALVGALLATPFAANAQSLDLKLGQCQDRATVEAMLQQDGQKILFVGKRVTDNSPVNVFYLNDKGYGYNTEFKKATDELCTRAAYKEAILNPVENDKIPSWAIGIKPNKGIDVQKIYAQKGEDTGRLVFVARGFSKNAQGQEVDGKAIVVAAAPLAKMASVWSVDSNGFPDGLLDMRDFGIVTKNFNQFVARGSSTSPIASAGSINGTTVAMRSNAPQ
jgi:hypothetical protein